MSNEPDEIHLLGWNGPIAELTIRWRRDANGEADINASWGRRIATTARMIIGENCLHAFPNQEPIGDARCEQCGITVDDFNWLHPRLAVPGKIELQEDFTPEQIAEWDQYWNAMVASGADANIVPLPGRFWRTEPRVSEYPVGGSAPDVPSA